jgi:hypothetical protein
LRASLHLLMKRFMVSEEVSSFSARKEKKKSSVKFCHARDVFVGRNFQTQNFERGLRLAGECLSDEDAHSFCELFRSWSPPYSPKHLRKFLEQRGEHDVALCLLGLIFRAIDSLKSAVALGNVVAHGALAAGDISSFCCDFSFYSLFFCVVVPPSANKLGLALYAAKSRDPQGLLVLGTCFEVGIHCTASLSAAMECYRDSANLGWIEAQNRYATFAFAQGTPERLRWLGKAARAARSGGERFARQFLDELGSVREVHHTAVDDLRRLMQDSVRVFGVAATDHELTVLCKLIAGGGKENNATDDDSAHLRMVKENARLCTSLSEAQQALKQQEAEVAALRLQLRELRQAGHTVLDGLREQSSSAEALNNNCMAYVHLSKSGVWSTKQLELPEACLAMVEVFELPREHPAAGDGAKGVRLRLDAERELEQGETVMYYAGHVRCGLERSQRDNSDYPCPLTEEQRNCDPVVDALYLGNASRFLNDPRGTGKASNCSTSFELLRVAGQKMWCVAVLAARRIARGEELMIDYGDAAYWEAKERRDGPYDRARSQFQNRLNQLFLIKEQ